MPDLGVTFAEQEQTIDIQDNCKNILMDLETTGDLQSDPELEAESSESYQQKTKDASNEKGTVDIHGQSKSPTKSANFLKSQVNYCFVCREPQTKCARHLERHVNENAEIAQTLQFPKSSKEKRFFLTNSETLATSSTTQLLKPQDQAVLK